MNRPGRPQGEIRQALSAAIGELGAGTWRELAAHAQVGFSAAKQTVRDMVRAGELAPDGEVRVAGSNRPMVRLVPASRGAAGGADACALDAAVRSWATFE